METYLRQLAIEEAKRSGDKNIQAVEVTGSLMDFAREAGCSKQTIANVLGLIAKKYEIKELHPKNRSIILPRQFWEDNA